MFCFAIFISCSIIKGMVGYKIQRMNDGIVPKKLLFLIFLFLTITGSGCRLSYLFHAGAGQLRILHSAIPIEKALKDDTLDQEQRNHLNLIEKIKAFGEAELGLVKTKSYETCFLNSEENRIYTISASPKDRLRFITWWFPIVGKVPYLGYFDLERAISQKRALLDKDLEQRQDGIQEEDMEVKEEGMMDMVVQRTVA